MKKSITGILLCISWVLNAQVALPTFQGVQNAGSELYSFSSHTFTTCGQTGPEGPTLSESRSTYSPSWTDDTDFFNVTDGIQYWTVPMSGTFRITAAGSVSGTRSGVSSGRGVIYRGDFNLTEGEIIRILCGQKENYRGATHPGGGGGRHDGSNNQFNQTQADATYSTTGQTAAVNGMAGGSNGDGGNHPGGSTGGCAGAGFFGNGEGRTAYPSSDGAVSKSFVNGGAGGGIGGNQATQGGFGGGGFTWYSTGWGGGGGGYSGGGTYGTGGSYKGNAGGGGSYNNGSNQTQLGVNTSDGYVTIEKL